MNKIMNIIQEYIFILTKIFECNSKKIKTILNQLRIAP